MAVHLLPGRLPRPSPRQNPTVCNVSATTVVAYMPIKSIFILNKAGSLIYQRDFRDDVQKLTDSNDYLVIAGTFHSVHALTSRISPTGSRSSGLQVMEMPGTTLHCFQTLTGVKFIVLTDPAQPNMPSISNEVYQIYADYVMKNPFYTLDMPIRCAKFDRELNRYILASAR